MSPFKDSWEQSKAVGNSIKMLIRVTCFMQITSEVNFSRVPFKTSHFLLHCYSLTKKKKKQRKRVPFSGTPFYDWKESWTKTATTENDLLLETFRLHFTCFRATCRILPSNLGPSAQHLFSWHSSLAEKCRFDSFTIPASFPDGSQHLGSMYKPPVLAHIVRNQPEAVWGHHAVPKGQNNLLMFGHHCHLRVTFCGSWGSF